MPDRKKPLYDTGFIKGFAVGYLLNTFLNKYAVVAALTGLAAGIASEQRDPDYWPNISDKTRDAVKRFKDLYNDGSDENR